MLAYRIGRVQLPWTNFVPPIRGGKFRTVEECRQVGEEAVIYNVEDADASSDEDASSSTVGSEATLWSSNASVASSIGESLEEEADAVKPTKYASTATLGQDLRQRRLLLGDVQACENVDGAALGQSRDAYISAAMQQEIDDCLRDYPSLDAATQINITKKYQALHERVKAEGHYDCRYTEYAKEGVRYVSLFLLFIGTLLSGEIGWGRIIISACFLGLFWHQIMFTAHDAGHRAITHSFVPDTLIGIFIADFCCGLSMGWWKSSHNVHHLITNHPEHDPDIQNVPFFATGPSFFKKMHSSYYDFDFYFDAVAEVAVRFQKYSYYPVMAIARFNLYALSWGHLLSGRSTNLGSARWTRPTEIAAMCCYWFLFGYCLLYRTIPTWPLRVAFVVVSHFVTMPLHVQITLSHWGMPTADLGEGESFAQRQLRTTMDVDCSEWLDWVHGGLQFQAVHHLFPRVPRHNLRRIQPLVREFCKETGIEYKILGFVEGNEQVLGRLEEVQKQVVMLLECQVHMAKTGESGLH